MAGFVMRATTLSGWVVPIDFIANLILILVVVFGFIVRESRSGRLYTLTILPNN